MAPPHGITLYHSPASRAFTAYWMLEELGVPFDVRSIDIRRGEQKSPAYLKLNPAGKVPTLTDGQLVVSENPAIAIYLADRYGYGTLAPKIEEADRGPYLKWMVFSTAVVDPVATLHEQKIDLPGFNFSFGAFAPFGRTWGAPFPPKATCTPQPSPSPSPSPSESGLPSFGPPSPTPKPTKSPRKRRYRRRARPSLQLD